MEFLNKVTVITPEAFNEFLSEDDNAIQITKDRMLIVTEVVSGVPVHMKVFAPGEWLTVETELVVADAEEEEEELDGWF